MDVRRSIYIHRDSEDMLLIRGVEFRELVRALPDRPNLLLLRHRAGACERADGLALDIVPAARLDALTAADIHSWGDFHWIDYTGTWNTADLTLDETLRLGHLVLRGELHGSPWFSTLDNKFVYRGHDDGWRLLLHVRDDVDIAVVLTRVIEDKLRALLSLDDPPPMPLPLVRELEPRMSAGWLIDLPNDRAAAELRVYNVGPLYDMDEHTPDRDVGPPTYTLVLAGDGWMLAPAPSR